MTDNESCSNCKHCVKMYVPPCDCFKYIPKDSFVCTAFLKEVNEVQYLGNDQGMCEVWTQKEGD